MKKNRIISLLVLAAMLVALCIGVGVSSFAAEENTTTESKGDIDVWLIGGQSNAVGYGTDMPADAATDPRYFVGFDNTLYFGIHEMFKYNLPEIEPLKVGKGQQVSKQSQGAETGIGKTVDPTGKMNAVIKCAVGATALYPDLTANISTQVGTWTSPSYIERANMSKDDPNYQALGTFVNSKGETEDIPNVDLSVKITNGNADNQGKVVAGNMYDMFIRTVTEGIRQLKEEGYTPKIRGMWWMQGEAEASNATKAWLYDELLTCLINDIREDVAEISGDTTVNDANDPMPFLAGNIKWNVDYEGKAEPKYLYQINNAQAMVKESMTNVSYLAMSITEAQSFFGQQDNWHYNTATQEFFGEQLVKYVLEVDGQKIVGAKGIGFTIEGGGTIKTGSDVTVTFKAKDGYRIDGITLGGNTVTLDSNNSYTIENLSEDTVFEVETTYIGEIEQFSYGTITAEYGDAHYYPFALYKNGSFVKGYSAWRNVMLAIPTGETTDEYVIVLRRDYTTAGVDSVGASRVANIGSKLTLDLGGYEMTRHKNAYIFDIYHNSTNKYTTNITLKNGTVVSESDNPIIGLNYGTGSANANDKIYNITFEEVTIINTVASRTIPLITACWENASSTAAAGVHANITLNGCTVNMGNISNGIVAGFTNDAKVTNTVGTLTVNGGNMIFGGKDYSLAKTDSLDTVTVGEYEGSYPKVTLPTGVTPSGDTYKDKNGTPCGTVAGSGVVSGSNTVYTFAPNTLATPYGTIGEGFADISTYPFAIFNADGFVTAVSNFGTAIAKARENMVNKEVTIYVRRSYDNANIDADKNSGHLTYINGTLKIDLNGCTLARKGRTLFDVYIDGKSSSGYVTNIEVYNGNLATKSDGPIIAMDYNGSTSQTAGVEKKFNMSFTNVKFYSEFTPVNGRSLVLDIWNEASKPKNVQYKTTSEFDFYGCTFDLTNMNNKHPFRMHDINGREITMDVAVNVYGGEFLNMAQSWMAYMDDGDTMNFGKYDGKYPTLTTAAGVDIKDIKTNFGALGTGDSADRTRIIKTSSDDKWNYYRVALQDATPYGNIAAQYDDMSKNPLAFFSYDAETKKYTFLKVGTFGTLRDYYYSDTNTAELNIVAYLRSNYTIDKNVDPTKMKGTLTLDLGGKVLTRDSTHMFDLVGTNDYRDFTSNTTVKNGTIVSVKSFVVGINNSAITGANKTWNITFEGVTFEYAKNNTQATGAFFNCWESTNSKEDYGYIVKVSYNNCIYDFTNAPKKACMFAFTGNDSTLETDVTATFNGGKVITPTMNNGYNLFSFTSGQDSVYFTGAPVQVHVAVSGTQPTSANTVVTSENTYSYIAVETGADYKLYNLEVLNSVENTPYADITGLTSETVSTANYPLAVFTPNGDAWTYKAVYKTWSEAVNAALATDGSVVYLRGNVEMTTSVPSLVGKQTSFTVDLNEKSIIKVVDGYLFSNCLGAALTSTHITFKNGSLVHGPDSNWKPFFNIDYGTDNTENNSSINYTFENVTFENNRTTYQKNFILCAFESKYAENIKDITSYIKFNNCTFKAAGAYLFDCTQEGKAMDKIDITIEVNGGTIIGDKKLTNEFFVRTNADGDSVTFGTYEGKYTTLAMPEGVSAPASSNGWFTTDGAKCVFVKVSENEGYTNYTLYPEVMDGYKIKTSVTLWSNFVFNIYIPKANAAGFTVNGNIVEYSEVVIEGVTYYHTKISLPAGEALDDIKVVVKLQSGSTTVDASWTLSVLSYTKAVMNGEFDATTKTLMKDMLAYASAAHTYFTNTKNVEDKLNEIATILEGYTKALPEDEAKAPAGKTYFTSATVYLGEVPSFRFYLADGYTAEDFSFKVGKRGVTAKLGNDNDGKGDYLEVVMYAYMMLDDVTYTVTDKTTNESVTESYNLYSYYDNVDEANTNLVALVAGLMKYSVSASAYRDSVVAVENGK